MSNPDLTLSTFPSLVVLAVLAWALLVGLLLRINHVIHRDARSIDDTRPEAPLTDPEETDR